MNRPILVLFVCKIMKFSNTFVPLVYNPSGEVVSYNPASKALYLINPFIVQ